VQSSPNYAFTLSVSRTWMLDQAGHHHHHIPGAPHPPLPLPHLDGRSDAPRLTNGNRKDRADTGPPTRRTPQAATPSACGTGTQCWRSVRHLCAAAPSRRRVGVVRQGKTRPTMYACPSGGREEGGPAEGRHTLFTKVVNTFRTSQSLTPGYECSSRKGLIHHKHTSCRLCRAFSYITV
jgi:hypothetical protein